MMANPRERSPARCGRANAPAAVLHRRRGRFGMSVPQKKNARVNGRSPRPRRAHVFDVHEARNSRSGLAWGGGSPALATGAARLSGSAAGHSAERTDCREQQRRSQAQRCLRAEAYEALSAPWPTECRRPRSRVYAVLPETHPPVGAAKFPAGWEGPSLRGGATCTVNACHATTLPPCYASSTQLQCGGASTRGDTSVTLGAGTDLNCALVTRQEARTMVHGGCSFDGGADGGIPQARTRLCIFCYELIGQHQLNQQLACLKGPARRLDRQSKDLSSINTQSDENGQARAAG